MMKKLISFSLALIVLVAVALVSCQKENLAGAEMCAGCQELPKNLDGEKIQTYLNLMVEQVRSSKSVKIDFNLFSDQGSAELEFVKYVYSKFSEEEKLSVLSSNTDLKGTIANTERIKYKRGSCYFGICSWIPCDEKCRPLGGSGWAPWFAYEAECR